MNKYRLKKSSKKDKICLLVSCLVVVGIVLRIGLSITSSFVQHERVITVTNMERINTKDYSKYLIFGEDEDGEVVVFENVDSTMYLKFNSSDIYGSLKIGETYTFKTVGYRIRFLDMYENIIKVKEK